MKKNFIIGVLFVLFTIASVLCMCYIRHTNSLQYQKKVLCKNISGLQNENDSLRAIMRNAQCPHKLELAKLSTKN